MSGRLYTIGEAASKLGVRRHTVGETVASREIATYPNPLNGNAKMIDEDGLDELREVFKPKPKAEAKTA